MKKSTASQFGFRSPILRIAGSRVAIFLLATATWLPAQEDLDGSFATKPAIEKRLDDVRGEIPALTPTGDPQLAALLQSLEATCQTHLSALTFAENSSQQAAEAAEALGSWSGFSKSPPYPLSMLDRIRNTLADLDDARLSEEAMVRIIGRAADSARDQLADHQRTQRQLQDTIAGSSGKTSDAIRELERVRVSSRIAAEDIARLDTRLRGERSLLAAIESKRQLAAKQFEAAADKTTFTKQELDEVLARFNTSRREALSERSGTGGEESPDNTLLTWRLEFLELEIEFWNLRYSSFRTQDKELKSDALVKFTGMKSRVDDWVEIGKLRLPQHNTQGISEFDPTNLRAALKSALSFQRQLGFAIEDLGGRGKIGPAFLERIKARFATLWNSELYLVDQDSYIDGKKVTSSQAVTFGKVFRLAIILTVGWFLLRFLSRRFAIMTERKKRVLPATSELMGRCAFILSFAILLIYGMNEVRIPLTAFAFLGGALAIGLGFGAQTLLKNFISGIILIFEKPIKIGDQVEVDGIRGSIRSVGLRSSVIQHYDGVDTLIPNSTLLENKLTNWTYHDSTLRQEIKVGVAYGSPTREVANALMAVAHEHGLVVDKPAPEVRLDDFGDNALIFTLLVWHDARKVPRATLASDLRFMIDKIFAEAGFVFAFPQRDIHFDSGAPLHVELRRASSRKNEFDSPSKVPHKASIP